MANFVHPGCPMIDPEIHRREALRRLSLLTLSAAAPALLVGCDNADSAPQSNAGVVPEPVDSTGPAFVPPDPEDERRLLAWVSALRSEGFADSSRPLGEAAIRVGELAAGTPYVAYTLEEYIEAGGSPARTEPLTATLTRFDCVSLVEACLAVARVARSTDQPHWDDFAFALERMRYRGGNRRGYSSRLHYFSEWMTDNEDRGLVRILGQELGGETDDRNLRFMTANAGEYPALQFPEVLEEIGEMEQTLDDSPRWVIPTPEIVDAAPQIQTGDILAFATAIDGLDVTHAAFAYRDADDVLRVLHAPLSGGVVEITDSTLPNYVRAINRSTGILIARPLDG